MPVELKELIIKATVDPGQTANEGTDTFSRDHMMLSEEERSQLLRDCAEFVLEILKEKSER